MDSMTYSACILLFLWSTLFYFEGLYPIFSLNVTTVLAKHNLSREIIDDLLYKCPHLHHLCQSDSSAWKYVIIFSPKTKYTKTTQKQITVFWKKGKKKVVMSLRVMLDHY